MSVKTFQSGQKNILIKRYIGQDIGPIEETGLNSITMGQLYTLFCYIGLAIAFVILILCLEVLFNILQGIKEKKQKIKKIQQVQSALIMLRERRNK